MLVNEGCYTTNLKNNMKNFAENLSNFKIKRKKNPNKRELIDKLV